MEYKIVIYAESAVSSLFFGSAKVDPQRFSEFLNEYAAKGWMVKTIERETRRSFIFSSREAFVVVLERKAGVR